MHFASSLTVLGPFVVAGALVACGKLESLAPPGGEAAVDSGPSCDPASCPSACCDGSASAADAGLDGSARDGETGANDAAFGEDASDGSETSVAIGDDAGDDGAIDAPDDQFVPYDAAAIGARCASTSCGGGGAPLVLSFSQYPALESVDGSVNVSFPGYADPVCQSAQVIVVQSAPGVWVAFQGSATRTCCPLQVYQGVFRDPCHGLEYDFCGAPINVPASPLQQLSACPNAGGVAVWMP